MKHSVWFRTLIALWGIWFATALTEPAGVLSCPMHSGVGGAVVADSHETAAPSENDHQHHQPSSARTPDAQQQADAPDAPSESGHHHCTCLGHCSAVAVHALATSAERWIPEVLAREMRQAQPVAVAYAATPIAHRQPFANGPPSAQA